MKTCNLSLATVALGALAVSYAACSAQGIDNTIPGGTSAPPASGGNGQTTAGSGNSSGGSGPGPATGSGGFVSHPGTGGSGTTPGAGGSKFNTGVGGATTATSGGRGPVGTGTGGSGTVSGGCPAAVGVATALPIDDLEDGDNVITTAGSRVGYWYTYNDGTATQVPDPKALFKPTAPGSTLSAKFAAATSGPAFTTYGAGMGFDFNNVMMKPCPYDATAYSGITFYAKSNGTAGLAIKAMVKTAATTASSSGGTCTAMCDDHFALKSTLTTAWAKYTITFSAATFAQEGFGTKAAFDKTKVLGMQFQVAKDLKFDFSIDDITFTP